MISETHFLIVKHMKHMYVHMYANVVETSTYARTLQRNLYKKPVVP